MNAAREVSKFRRVVEMLAEPDPLVYGGMILGGASPLLSQALPMVDESPFAALPDGTDNSAENNAPSAASPRATALPDASQVQAVRKPPSLARRRDETGVAPSAATVGTNASAPVFSLRRAPQREGGGRVEQAFPETAPSAALPAADRKREFQAGPEHVPASAPAPADRRINNPPQLAKLPHKGSDEGMHPQADVGSLEPASGPSAYAAGAALHAALEEVGRLAGALMDGSGASPASFASTGEPPAAGRGAAGANPESSLRDGDVSRPGSALNAAIEEVGRLAGALAGGSGVSPASFASRVPTAGGGIPELQAGEQQLRRPQAGVGRLKPAPPLAGEPDAEWLAALVNEALAEQARRHGVDLS